MNVKRHRNIHRDYDYKGAKLQFDTRKLDIVRSILQEREIGYELEQLRVIYALSNLIELDQSERKILFLQNQIVEIENDIVLEKHLIQILMGLSPDDVKKEIEIPNASFVKPFPLPDELPLNLLSRRPDLMAQIWRVEAAAKQIGAAKAAFYPNLNL